MDDYVRTCMCGAPGRESDARDRLIDVCSRLSALVCLQAVNGDVCVCVFPSLDCIVEKKVATQRPIVPSSPVFRLQDPKMLYLRTSNRINTHVHTLW